MSATILMAGGGTGGHVFPMIAVADAIRRLAPDIEPIFVGTARGLETRLVPERGYQLETVHVLPIRGGGVAGAFRGVGRAAASLPESRELVRRLDPSAVFSIGGYAAGPVSLAAWSRGVPVALMEPNSVPGLANRLAARFIKRAYTAFPESEATFPKRTVLRSGVPIRAGFDPRPYSRRRPLRVLVLGGSQGARALNAAMPGALAHAATPVRVVHQTGRDNAKAVAERYTALGVRDWADVTEFIDDMPAALTDADIVIGRSGAGVVSEICAVGRPAILVPYPFASGDHQRRNAESLERDGAAVCLVQSEATPERIAAELDRVAESDGLLEKMALAANRRGRPNAALTIARDLLGLAGLGSSRVTEPSASADRRDPGALSLALEEAG